MTILTMSLRPTLDVLRERVSGDYILDDEGNARFDPANGYIYANTGEWEMVGLVLTAKTPRDAVDEAKAHLLGYPPVGYVVADAQLRPVMSAVA